MWLIRSNAWISQIVGEIENPARSISCMIILSLGFVTLLHWMTLSRPAGWCWCRRQWESQGSQKAYCRVVILGHDMSEPKVGHSGDQGSDFTIVFSPCAVIVQDYLQCLQIKPFPHQGSSVVNNSLSPSLITDRHVSEPIALLHGP